MLKDWNFWCTVMTSIAAFIVIYLSVRQIQLSNKQQLFDRRLKAYMLVNGIISLCRDNYMWISGKREAEPQLTNDFFFKSLTNNAYMESQAKAIQHPLDNHFTTIF